MKVPILVGVRLSTEQCPKTQEEEEDMSCVPYGTAVGSLMYAVGVLSRFVKTREGALDSSELGFQVFAWH